MFDRIFQHSEVRKNTQVHVVFSNLFSMFGNVVKHSLSCFIYYENVWVKIDEFLYSHHLIGDWRIASVKTIQVMVTLVNWTDNKILRVSSYCCCDNLRLIFALSFYLKKLKSLKISQILKSRKLLQLPILPFCR